MSTDLSAALVRDFWRDSAAHHGTRARLKARSLWMKLVALVLHTLRILPRQRFMERYTTVMFRTIYTPFTPGVASSAHDLWSQIVIATHEHQHVLQAKRDGPLRFSAAYLLSGRHRARLEAEAYCCNMELDWWFCGRHRDPRELAEGLVDYGCNQRAIAEARAILDACARRLADTGEVRTRSARWTIDWLSGRGVRASG